MKTKIYIKMLLVLFMAFASTVVFADTAPVTVNTYDSNGDPIAAKFKVFKGPNYVGEYDGGSTIQLDIGGTYKLFAHYQKTSTDREEFVVQASGHTYNFYTANITFHWTGGYLDYQGSGSWKSFGKTEGVWNSRELFPKDFYGNTMKFKFGYKWNDPRTVIVEMDYFGQNSIEKVVSQLQLLDHNGDPLAGGTARGGTTTPTSWHVSGSTNANGLLLDMRDGSNTNLSYEMTYNSTIAVVAQQIGSLYEFQTQLLTLKMETCDGNPLDGGSPAYGSGTNAGSWWFPGGSTGTSNPGETEAEFFPGTYSFRMQYQHTTEYKYSFNFPVDGNEIVWTTTKLTLNYGSSISYGGTNGTAGWFAKPSMELLAGTYKFKFTGAGTTDITIQGCSMTKAATTIKLIDSNGDGIEGGIATYYKSGWKSAGTTDVNGEVFTMIDGSATKYSFRMKWAGFSQQQSGVDITLTNPVLFQTIAMVARLESSVGADLAGGVATYYASGWKALGTTLGDGNTAPIELLPGKYSFRMKYLGYSQQKSGINITGTNPIVYATTPMEVQLKNSESVLMDEGVVTYYASGWKSFGTTSGGTISKELLPGKYSFRLKYAGFSQQKSGVMVDGDSPLVYQTKSMEVQLEDSNGDPLDAGVVTYYASGWKSFGTTSGGTISKELLPGKYSFRLKYAGYSQKKSGVMVDEDSPLVYKTEPMVVSLQTCNPTGLAGGDVTYYASGWKTFGTTDANGDATKELLPGKYSFRMKYIGQSNKKSGVNIVTTNPLIYNTTNVALSYNGTIKYYASGWKIFTQPAMEMLPHNYTFRIGSSQTSIDVNGCSVSQGWVLLTILDENGNGVSGGKAKPAYGGSWGAVLPGQTDANGKLFTEIPTGYTKIKMTVNQTANEQSLSELNTSNYTWITGTAIAQVNDDIGSPISGVAIKQGGGTWVDWGVTDNNGQVKISTFTGYNVKLEATINKSSQTIIQNNSASHIFQTGKVERDMVYTGTVKASIGGSWMHLWPNQGSSAQILPGNYSFVYSTTTNETVNVMAGYTKIIPNGTNTASSSNKSDKIATAVIPVVEEFSFKAYPNPFFDKAKFEFVSPEDTHASILIYDITGRMLKIIFDNPVEGGVNYNAEFAPESQVNGMYFYRLTIGEKVYNGKIVYKK